MTVLFCRACDTRPPVRDLNWCCPNCGSYLDAHATRPFRRADIATSEHSLWRYAKATIHEGPVRVTLGEGWTPLVKAEIDGVTVGWKCEFISISGSFKDRGVAVMMNHLIASGVGKVAEDSSGNGGAAVATYAAAAGLPCRIYVPAANSPGKITQIAATGAEVRQIAGSRSSVAEAAMQDGDGYFYASHNWHPAFIDGTKTVGYEIWEQWGFSPPDVILAPTGGGSNLLGSYQAFSELKTAGEIDRLPRFYGAQSAGCAPLAAAFATGAETYVKVATAPTVAEGIVLDRPVRAREVLALVRATGGGIFAVEEEEIIAAQARLAHAGLYVEPTSATAAALLTKLIANGTIRKGERVAVILTGSGLKAGELLTKLRLEGPSAG
jgi:threonine synthase